MEGAPFLQEAVVAVGAILDLPLTHSYQLIEENVAVMDFQLQHVVFLSGEVLELLLPPGVLVVVTHRRFTQRRCVAEHLDVAVCGSQEVGGKIRSSQVKHLDLSLSYAQTEDHQHKTRKSGGHGATGAAEEHERFSITHKLLLHKVSPAACERTYV